jgi:peptide/nickel transport system substrate-binding protein
MSRGKLWIFGIALMLVAPFALVAGREQHGGYVDTIYFDVKMKQEVGLKDTVEGMTDLFYIGLPGALVEGLDPQSKDKLDMYIIPSGSWSLLFNPIPNKAPYIVKADNKENFNPFGIREVRFAMHNLINRQFVVNEIQNGMGGPMITTAKPCAASAAFYNQIPPKLGLTPQGNEQKALQDINSALTEASRLPELSGRLQKKGQFWTFDGKPVTIKFVIRVDDPQRTRLGEYVSRQIEKTGIKVQRLMWDRSKSSNAIYGGNPADYEWTLYTEGWGAGQTYPYWDLIISQMYAPFYGYMPGGQNPSNWNYENDELDRLGQKALFGNVLTDEDYWDTCEKATIMGLEEAIRVYVSYQTDYYVANKDRFNARMLYGLGDGINRLSLMSANTKDGILRVTEFSAQGSLFMAAWDPVGVDGFSDTYSQAIWRAMEAHTLGSDPVTGMYENETVTFDWSSIRSKVREVNGEAAGDLSVPSSALLYDTAQKKWVQVGSGVKAMSTGTETVNLWKWHDGHMMSMADVIACIGFDKQWATEDGTDDPYFDNSYSSMSLPGIETVKGYVFDTDKNQVTTYVNYNFPADKNQVMGSLAAGVGGVNYCRPIPWQLREAIGKMVADGSASGTVYSLTYGEAEDVDILSPGCVSDIRAELVEMKSSGYIPDYLEGYTTEGEALEGYNSIIKFIDEKGHAGISNGPFYLENYNPVGPSLTLKRWKDHPFTPEYWIEKFSTKIPKIDRIDVPLVTRKDKDVSVAVMAKEVKYPQGITEPALNDKVVISLVLPDKTLNYPAEHKGNGVYAAIIPAAEIKGLPSGVYVLAAVAENPEGLQTSSSASVIVK